MKFKFLLLLFLLFASVIYSQDFVVVNSQNGMDVLSGVFYAKIIGTDVKFLSYSEPISLLAGSIGENKHIFLIQSSDLPVSSLVRNPFGPDLGLISNCHLPTLPDNRGFKQ